MRQQNLDQPMRIVILGGGTAGWMTAAALSKLAPKSHYQIILVESEAIGTVGVGEATLPSIRTFNQILGIDESEFIDQTKATFKLGIEFSNWGEPGNQYIHPFGDYGEPINDIPIHQYWLKHRKYGGVTTLDNYSVVSQLCAANKFSIPSALSDSIEGQYSYAYHLDAGLYARYLSKLAQKNGVNRVEGKVTEVLSDKVNGNIETLIVENGRSISGDFFIDCSGFTGRLIQQTLGSEFEDWSHWLPCNKAIAVASQANSELRPYTQAFAHDAGWQWRIPLQHRVGNGIVYCDRYKSEQSAMRDLFQTLDGEALSEPKSFSFKTGKVCKPWLKNCVAIGLSSGFLEPLESTSIHLIQVAILQLIEALPTCSNESHKAEEFNRVMDNELCRIRDFLILHYYLNDGHESSFWRDCQTMRLPSRLQETLTLFSKTGQLERYQHGLFLEPSWLSVLLGQGKLPRDYDAKLINVGPLTVEQLLRERRLSIAKYVAQCPSHSGLLRQLEPNFDPLKRCANESF